MVTLLNTLLSHTPTPRARSAVCHIGVPGCAALGKAVLSKYFSNQFRIAVMDVGIVSRELLDSLELLFCVLLLVLESSELSLSDSASLTVGES